jgi:hypothetical protein
MGQRNRLLEQERLFNLSVLAAVLSGEEQK